MDVGNAKQNLYIQGLAKPALSQVLMSHHPTHPSGVAADVSFYLIGRIPQEEYILFP